jgi:hypothetical protein
MRLRRLFLISLVAALASCASAASARKAPHTALPQTPTQPKPAEPKPADDQQADGATGDRSARRLPDTEIKPYDRVITRQAKSAPGLFTVHRIKDKVYYEIPVRELGKEFL